VLLYDARRGFFRRANSFYYSPPRKFDCLGSLLWALASIFLYDIFIPDVVSVKTATLAVFPNALDAKPVMRITIPNSLETKPTTWVGLPCPVAYKKYTI
jgi:hypothetical protein